MPGMPVPKGQLVSQFAKAMKPARGETPFGVDDFTQMLNPSVGQGNGNGNDPFAGINPNNLLDKMGLDGFELSPDSAASLQYASAQFEVNYQAIRSINGANGQETTQINFSFSASFEYLQMSSGAEAPFGTEGAEGAGANDPIAMLKDFFSPESTAGRILDFALGFFPASEAYETGGDTEEARSQFADFIGGAIQKGFDEALGILGELPGNVQEDIDKTHDIVFSGLDDFVNEGLDQEKVDNGAYDRVRQFQQSQFAMSFEMNYTAVSSVASYDQGGQSQASGDGGVFDTTA